MTLFWFLHNRTKFLPQDICVTLYTLAEKCNIGNVIMQSFWGFVSHFRFQFSHIWNSQKEVKVSAAASHSDAFFPWFPGMSLFTCWPRPGVELGQLFLECQFFSRMPRQYALNRAFLRDFSLFPFAQEPRQSFSILSDAPYIPRSTSWDWGGVEVLGFGLH